MVCTTYRVVIELRVDPSKQLRTRKRGGEQWVFPSDGVAIVGVRFKCNAPPKKGEQRLDSWSTTSEAVVHGCSVPRAVCSHDLDLPQRVQ
eukprot:1344120-Amphidinium_carterae.3